MLSRLMKIKSIYNSTGKDVVHLLKYLVNWLDWNVLYFKTLLDVNLMIASMLTLLMKNNRSGNTIICQ